MLHALVGFLVALLVGYPLINNLFPEVVAEYGYWKLADIVAALFPVGVIFVFLIDYGLWAAFFRIGKILRKREPDTNN